MIERRRDYSKKEPSKDASKIYIICEGAGTERDYYEFFEGLSSNLQLIVIPPEDGTDPLKLMALAEKELLSETRRYTLDFKQSDRIWFAIDTDTWEDEGKIKPLRDFCAVQNEKIKAEYDEVKPYEAWRVAQSNPCFEIWLYYHHYPELPDTDEVTKWASFKEFVFRKISGGYDFQKDPARIKDAIENSEKNFTRKPNGNPDLYSTEQFLLGKDILAFVRDEINKLRNKMN